MTYRQISQIARDRNSLFEQNYAERDGALIYVGKPRKRHFRASAVPMPRSCISAEPIRLTLALLNFGRTAKGGVRPASAKLLGVPKLYCGWLKGLVGAHVPYRNWCRFVHANRGYWPTTEDVLRLTS